MSACQRSRGCIQARGLDVKSCGETWRKNVITGRTRMPSDPSVSKRVTANKWGQDAADTRASTVTGCTKDASSAMTGGNQQRLDEGRLNLGLAWTPPAASFSDHREACGKESTRAKRTEIVGGQMSNAERHEGREENLDHDREGGGSKIAAKQFLKGKGDEVLRTALWRFDGCTGKQVLLNVDRGQAAIDAVYRGRVLGDDGRYRGCVLDDDCKSTEVRRSKHNYISGKLTRREKGEAGLHREAKTAHKPDDGVDPIQSKHDGRATVQAIQVTVSDRRDTWRVVKEPAVRCSRIDIKGTNSGTRWRPECVGKKGGENSTRTRSPDNDEGRTSQTLSDMRGGGERKRRQSLHFDHDRKGGAKDGGKTVSQRGGR
ncbi:hypothetical protein B0H11DRAFT_1929509 [Mycena galericulata]|nr:hypothetical protein B0H11DRAFT_1929509 [Mycena galericulata]